MTTIAPANQTLAPGAEPTITAAGLTLKACERCGFKGKVYRGYNCFIHPGDIMCYKCHVETGSQLNTDGSLAWQVLVCPTAQDPKQYWGMSSGPAEDWARVQALPDNK